MMSKLLNAIGWFADKMNLCRLHFRKNRYLKSLHIGKNSLISGETDFGFPNNIYIGDNSYINAGGVFAASKNASITIGNNCLISYNVFMRTDSHNYLDKNELINKQGMNEKSIVIGDDVWIGYGAMIMSGVNVANGCVIGANAVVTEDTEPYSVYAGVPARKIKERT